MIFCANDINSRFDKNARSRGKFLVRREIPEISMLMILICNSYPQDTLFYPFNYAGENIEKWKSTRGYLTLDNAIGFLRCIFTRKKANLIPLLLVLFRMEFKVIHSSFVQKKNVKGSVRNWFSVCFKNLKICSFWREINLFLLTEQILS